MALAREQKIENAEALRAELAEIPNAILVDFQGLGVVNATELRRKLRAGDANFRVVKNSVALRAISELPLAQLSDSFVGQTAIAYTEGDVVSLAKTLKEFAKEFETPNFKAGMVDGALITAEEFAQLAELPPREELIGKALFLMNYPITGFVTALSGILSGFVSVLEQIRKQKEDAGDAPAVAEAAPAEEAAEAEEAAPAEEPAEAEDAAPAEEAAETEDEDKN